MPVVEDCQFDAIGETSSFLCEDPRTLWKKGMFSKVPILTGNTDVEGAVLGWNILTDSVLRKDFNSKFMNALESMTHFSGSSISENQRNLNKIAQIYFKNVKQLNSQNEFGLLNVRLREIIELF
jgi:hypothetical protein